ncbi:MAG: hypothetical protein P8L37_06625 [Phycisphaerales bacterium]|nr:hypothetical protein [Phycisphaerales bacterium]
MSTPSSRSFGELFSAGWSTFKNNYGLCLGITFLLLLVYFVSEILTFAAMFLTPDHLGLIAASVVGLVVSLIIPPVAARMGFWLVRRTRGGERSQRGRYGTLVGIAFLAWLCFLPSLICNIAAHPGGMVPGQHAPGLFAAGMQQGIAKSALDRAVKADVEKHGKLEKDSPDRAEREKALAPLEERYQAATAKMDKLRAKQAKTQEERTVPLLIAAMVLMVAGWIFLLFWAPWALYAAIDPLEDAATVKQALARGRELARNASVVSIWFVPMLCTIIAGITLVMICLPGLFFGVPLMVAVIPGMYMCLRGERGDEGETVPAAA